MIDDFVFEEQLIALYQERESAVGCEMARQVVVKLLKESLCDGVLCAVGPCRFGRFVEQFELLLDRRYLRIDPGLHKGDERSAFFERCCRFHM